MTAPVFGPMTGPLWFDICFDRLMGHEGGYVNDPNDPGGETKWGISKRSYPALNIKQLTREDAKVIYYRDFWKRINGDLLHKAISFQLFDFAVNSGPAIAVTAFEDSAKRSHSVADMVMHITAYRLEFLTTLKNWPHHGKGWARRMATNLRYGAQDA